VEEKGADALEVAAKEDEEGEEEEEAQGLKKQSFINNPFFPALNLRRFPPGKAEFPGTTAQAVGGSEKWKKLMF